MAVDKKNQTDPNWLAQITEIATELGTGIFVVSQPQVEVGSIRKEFVEQIVYSECVARGDSAVAFKWVPHFIADANQLRSTPCERKPCVDTCVKPGCVCVKGFCE